MHQTLAAGSANRRPLGHTLTDRRDENEFNPDQRALEPQCENAFSSGFSG
jgi:hypothetical protein